MTIHQKHHLMLMRHGKSDWTGARHDMDRPLTSRGKTDARKIGRWMRDHEYIPDLIVSSPAQRTRDTAAIVCSELQTGADLICWDAGIYEATQNKLLTVLQKHTGNSCMLMIGHNPGLEALVSWLADNEPGRTVSGKLMTTAALAVFSSGKMPIEPVPHSLRLQYLIRPKEIS